MFTDDEGQEKIKTDDQLYYIIFPFFFILWNSEHITFICNFKFQVFAHKIVKLSEILAFSKAVLINHLPIVIPNWNAIDINHGVLESPFPEVWHFVWTADSRISTKRKRHPCHQVEILKNGVFTLHLTLLRQTHRRDDIPSKWLDSTSRKPFLGTDAKSN